MKFKSTIFLADSALGYSGVQVPDEIVVYFKNKAVSRFIFTVNDTESFNGAFVPYEKGKFLIIINSERQKKLRKSFGDDIEILIEEDNSEYGMPLPDEMAIAFNEDPEGSDFFHKLKPGKMRSLLYIVGKFKSADKRIEKSIIILEHLRSNHGQLDFKMLNIAFKEYGKR